MTPEQALEISTTDYENLTDAQLREMFAVAIVACAPLPGSEEEEKLEKQRLKEAQELAELEAEANATTTTITPTIKTKKPKAKKATTNEKMKELLDMMAKQGLDMAKVAEQLPKELKF